MHIIFKFRTLFYTCTYILYVQVFVASCQRTPSRYGGTTGVRYVRRS